MVKVSGLGDNFYVNGYDLSGDISSVDTISSPMTPIDVTALTQFAHQRAQGLRDGMISFTTFFDTVGGVTSPGVPASTVPLQSTYAFPVRVTIIAGTLTHIFINGIESLVPVAPPVPANSVPVTNTTGAEINVTISGGTMSQVVVNGAQVGTGAGIYQLDPGDVIYMIYTVAPTWTWANGGATYTIPAFGTISLTYSVAPTWNWFVRGQEHNALAGLISPDQICMYMRGSAIGNPAACMVSKQTDYDPTRDASANLTVKVDWQANGFGIEWGKQLTQGLRTDITATTGPAFTDAAATAFGAQAYLQLVELVGSNVDVTITHATTVGGTYNALMDFGSLSAIGAVRQAVSNVTTVNQFLKVNTTGTFTMATFAVIFVRNLAAGQQF